MATSPPHDPLIKVTSRVEQMREECRDFHRRHPEVWRLFERFTLELIATGRQHGGVGAIWERLRWETAVNPEYAEVGELKLNNNFRAFYARAFAKRHPEHDGFFRTRAQVSVNAAAKSETIF